MKSTPQRAGMPQRDSVDYFGQEQKQNSAEEVERGETQQRNVKQGLPQRQLQERPPRGPGLCSICLSLLMSSLNLATALFLIIFILILLFLLRT